MTEFDLIIEATRRGFLKQIGGALATPTTTIKNNPITNSSRTVYDITSFLAPDKIADIARDIWYNHDHDASFEEDAEEFVSNYVENILHELKTGKPLDSDFLRAALLDYRNLENIYDRVGSLFKSVHPDIDNDRLRTYLGIVDDLREIPDLGDAFSELKDYLMPGDIVANGRVLFSKDHLIHTGFFQPLDYVKTNAQDYLSQIDSWLEKEDQKDKDRQVKAAEKQIQDTHSNLGIRRDSAWYESVLKEQDGLV